MEKYIDQKEKIFIEFVGLPGSGKTSIAKEILEKMSDNGNKGSFRLSMNDERKSQKIKKNLRGIWFLLIHPAVIIKIFYLSFSFKKVNKFLLLLKVFTSQSMAINSTETCTIYDQGFMNMLLYMANDKTDWKQVQKIYLEILPSNLCILILQSDVDLALNRANERPFKNHFSKKEDRNKVKEVYLRYERNLENLSKNIQSICHLNMDAQESIKYNSNRFFHFLNGKISL